MNNQSPFILYKTNRHEFLTKMCSICWCTLFFPESKSKMVHCCKLECDHMFHVNCIEQLINTNHLSCPECRAPINTINIKNVNKSLEMAIRDDAFDHGNIDENLKTKFANSILLVADYPYHKLVFERWQNELK